MYKTDEQYKYEWWKASDGNEKLKKENVALTKDVKESEEDYDALEYSHKQAANANKQEYNKQHKNDFIPSDADVKLYEFIAQSIDEHCVDGKGFKGGFMQNSKGEVITSTGDALLSVFADPLVQEKVKGLPTTMKARFEEEVEALSAADSSLMADTDDSDDGADGGADLDHATDFMQLKQDPSENAASFFKATSDADTNQNPKRLEKKKGDANLKPIKDVSQSKWAKSPEKGASGINCDDLRSMVGIELVCKRKIRDAEAASLQEMQERHQDEATANRQALLVARQKIDNMEKQKKDNSAAMGVGEQQMKDVAKNLGQEGVLEGREGSAKESRRLQVG
jgi:hypothetical protein